MAYSILHLDPDLYIHAQHLHSTHAIVHDEREWRAVCPQINPSSAARGALFGTAGSGSLVSVFLAPRLVVFLLVLGRVRQERTKKSDGSLKGISLMLRSSD